MIPRRKEVQELLVPQGTSDMTSFKRKMVRNSKNKFMKKMKSTMKSILSGVHCSVCERPPREGEKIDNWRMLRTENSMILTCPECHQKKQEELENENV